MARMRKKSTGQKSYDLSLPYDLTNQLVERINALPSSVKTDYLKAELLTKLVSSDTDPADVRRQRAINKWLAAERDNEATNDRLLTTPGEYNILPRVSFERFSEFCRSMIADIIGDTPPVDALIGSFSGGASTSRGRTISHPALKYVGVAHVTPNCKFWFDEVLPVELPLWLGDQFDFRYEVVPGNVLFTVPKKTDIDRVACKEPDLNMFIQKGIGNYIRDCLRRIGINLRDQTNNRSLAHRGSVTNELATLDLSSASDSVTTGLVAHLLPVTWYTLLDSVRSPVTIIDGEEHQNQMFSSMGNGFTFELETLLFYVLVRATNYFRGVPGVVSVYGDDIICPAESVSYVTWVLSYFGFQVNPEKSWWDGPFRESCGGHYWNGFDITPFYIRKPIDTLLDLIDVANKLRQWAVFGPHHAILDPEVEDIWVWLKSHVPNSLWGGEDTTFKFQLVSNDPPKCRLSEETSRSSTGEGGYLQWHNATWDRSLLRDGVSTSSRSVSRNRYRLRSVRNKPWPRLTHLFYHEVVGNNPG